MVNPQVFLKPKPTAAVIGAGISGLMCARSLLDQGWAVSVFEKSRGVGGRMATRRVADDLHFDHGAQYFTARDEQFARHVNSWITDGIVSPWVGRVVTVAKGQVVPKLKTTPRFVSVPGMNGICKHLGRNVDIRFQHQIAPPVFDQNGWQLIDQEGRNVGRFDYVIATAPSDQSALLLAESPPLQRQAQSQQMRGCWSVMLAFQSALDLSFDGAFVHESPLSWIARNSSKPYRDGPAECWVLHASAEWTTEHLEAEHQDVVQLLTKAFLEATGQPPLAPSYRTAHRWRYAIPEKPLDTRCLFDDKRRIGACGDWCGGPRVEGAFLSGLAMAERLLTHAAHADT